ncbi:hypothetical protein BpHYR1_053170 [Brachionus plicatilis]|uniref:Uncharacterized protein n=1 Tax=Brachionus plicatilis TaxID=10195 RepID=A0A3M7QMS1_BRAPC|nr:hypothetical protein BpHYR1_053170 [Brachionus plicatilis]
MCLDHKNVKCRWMRFFLTMRQISEIYLNFNETLKTKPLGYYREHLHYKWQIVSLLKSVDKKQNEIAKLLGVSSKCVSSTKQRYSETGTLSVPSRIASPQKEIRKNPTSSYQKVATDFNSKTQRSLIQRQEKHFLT